MTRKIHTQFRPLFAGLMILALAACLIFTSKPAAADGPPLWKISDADSEIWLFGTVHILNPTLTWRTDKIDAAIRAADTLVTEANVNELTPSDQQALVMRYGVNSSGTSFLNQLSPEGLDNFKGVVQSLGMPTNAINQFAGLRPWLAAITVQVLQTQARGGSQDAGVDKILWQQARRDGKRLAYLETAEEQMQVFGRLTEEQELFFFEESMRQMLEQPDLLDQIVGDWMAGAPEALAEKMQAAMIGQDALYAAMLTDRNTNWADQIEDMLAGDGKIFIAVGAAHLAGEDSVQDLLAARGITAVRQQ